MDRGRTDARLCVLARHLTSAPRNALYEWLVHDNAAARGAIFELLKVS